MTETVLKTKIRIFLSILLFLEIMPQEKETFKIVSLEILEVITNMYICSISGTSEGRDFWKRQCC